MRKAVVIAVVATIVLGVAGLAYAASTSDRSNVFEFGVGIVGPVYTLKDGETACQYVVGLPVDVRKLTLVIGPANELRGPYRISLRDSTPTGRVLGQATVPREPVPPIPVTVTFDREVTGDRDVALCVENQGKGGVELYGDFDSSSGLAPPRRFAGRVLSNPTRSTDDLYAIDAAHPDGVQLFGRDISAYFPGDKPTSLLQRLPAAFEHASRFKLSGVGTWTFWALLALAVLAAPFALGRALSLAERDGWAGPE